MPTARLNEKEIAVAEEVYNERKVKKRQFILQEGEICKHNTYVVEVCFRMYFVDPNGKEHNLQYAIENWWIGDIGSSHSETPTKLNIEELKTQVSSRLRKKININSLSNFPSSIEFLEYWQKMPWERCSTEFCKISVLQRKNGIWIFRSDTRNYLIEYPTFKLLPTWE